MSQKIWKQIGLYAEAWNEIEAFQQENHLKTQGIAITEALKQLKRFKFIVDNLEKQAQEAAKLKELQKKEIGKNEN